jgi:hypothetical protein
LTELLDKNPKNRHRGYKDADRYFGSDLNKFIYENCTKQLTVNNIDLVMFKYKKGGKHVLRIIESKHTQERKMNDGQKNILGWFRDLFVLANSADNTFKNITFELYVVYADQPYDKLKVYDAINEVYFTIVGRGRVIDWLEMK